MSADNDTSCYICQKTVTSEQKPTCFALFTCYTQTSNAKLVEKVSEIAYEPILVADNDVVCRKCYVLLNTIDRLEAGLDKLRTEVRLQLESRYASYQLTQTITDNDSIVHTSEQLELHVGNDEQHVDVSGQGEVGEAGTEVEEENNVEANSTEGDLPKRQSKLPDKYSDYETNIQPFSRSAPSPVVEDPDDEDVAEADDIEIDMEPAASSTVSKDQQLPSRNRSSMISVTLGVKGPEISGDSPAARLLKKYYPSKDLKSAESRKAALASFIQKNNPDRSPVKSRKSILQQELLRDKQSEENAFQCENCGKCFDSRRALYQHSMRERGLVHKCKYCGQGFVSQSRWQKHEWEHTGIQGHVCEICGKIFQSKTGLRNHVAFHKGDYKYTCRTCGKGFCQKMNYMSHCAIHTGAKTFHCTLCNDYFRHYSSLWSHKILIHGQSKKKYKCHICSKEYNLPNHLSAHKKTHLDIKPYCCDYCHKRFTRATSLKLHMSTHTKQYIFNCNMCDFHSNRKYRATVHLQNVHSMHPNIIKDSFNTLIKIHRRNLQEMQQTLQAEEQSYNPNSAQVSTVNTDDINQAVVAVQPVVSQPYYEAVYIQNVSEGTAPVVQAVRSLEIVSNTGNGTGMMF